MEPMKTYMWMKMAAAGPCFKMITSRKSTHPKIVYQVFILRCALRICCAFHVLVIFVNWLLTFEREDLEQSQHGIPYVVEVESPWVHPNSGHNQARFQLARLSWEVHFGDEDLGTENPCEFCTYTKLCLHIFDFRPTPPLDVKFKV